MMTPTLRLRWVFDQDGQENQDGCDGKPLPESPEVYAANPVTPGGGPALTYAEYCAYYGNPDRHCILGVILQAECRCCGEWKMVESLWGIDFMDDASELKTLIAESYETRKPHWYDQATAERLPGYAGEVVRELIAEYRSTTGRRLRMGRRS